LAIAGYAPVTFDNLSTGDRKAVLWGPLEVGDILDAHRLHEVVRKHRPRGLLHFAGLAQVGESMQHPDRYYRTNVVGSITLFDVCRAEGLDNLVFSSTCAVYGAPEHQPITETSPLQPINVYGRSKLMAERILHDVSAASGLRYFSLRYFNAAGADAAGELGECHEVETRLIPLALDAVLGRCPPLQVLGDTYPTADGTAIRDYIHVTDLAEAHVKALDVLTSDGPSCTMNLGTGIGHSVREVLACVREVTGRDVPHVVAAARDGDPPVLVADPTLARAVLGGDLASRSELRNIVETAWSWRRRV
jgi:UDP-glucose-4-epimerase GalE